MLPRSSHRSRSAHSDPGLYPAQMALPETSDVACLSTDGERLYAVGHMHGIYVIDPRARRAADKLHSVESQGVSTDTCFEQILASILRLAVQSDDSTNTGSCSKAVCVDAWRRASDLCSFGMVCCPLEMALARYVQTYRVFKIHSDKDQSSCNCVSTCHAYQSACGIHQPTSATGTATDDLMQVSFHDLRKRTPESEQRADRATQPAAAGPALTLFLGNGFLLENDLYRYFAEPPTRAILQLPMLAPKSMFHCSNAMVCPLAHLVPNIALL